MKLRIRRLEIADKELFAWHLMALDKEGRYNRFGYTLANNLVVSYAYNAFGAGDLIYGGFEGLRLVGVGELRFAQGVRPNPQVVAEAALSVVPDRQGCGIGAQMYSHVRSEALVYGFARVVVMCVPDNHAVRHLLDHKFDIRLRRDGDTLIGHDPVVETTWLARSEPRRRQMMARNKPQLKAQTNDLPSGNQTVHSDDADPSGERSHPHTLQTAR